jgi:hypothetical protein
MDEDARSYRVAVVADRFVNPGLGEWDALPLLSELGWGVIQLPSDKYPDAVAMPLITQVAEHVDEFLRHGYQVVLIGERAGLDDALKELRVAPLRTCDPATGSDLRQFLTV